MHALSKDCFYIGALGSRKTHGRRVERLKAQGISDNEIAAHPCADRARYRRGLAAGDRGVDHGRDHRAPAAIAGEGGMKFGPFATGRGARRHGRAHDPRGRAGAEEGHGDRRRLDVAALKAAGIAEVVVARLDPGDVSEDDAAAAIAATASGEGVRADKAFTGRCNLFADNAGVLVVDRARDRCAQPHRRGGHARDAAGLQAGGRGRDDRHGEDHSVRCRGRRLHAGDADGRRPRSRWCGSRPTRSGRSAWCRRCCRGCRPRWSTRR